MIKSTIQGLLVAAIALGASASAIADDEDAGHLHGIWRMTRTPINCQSGQQVAPSFQAIMTFHEDGTLTGYAVPPASSPALQSPEFGLWNRERGRGNYSFTDLSFTYDQGGAFAGSIELTAEVQLGADGDTLTHETRIDIFDGNGAFLLSHCGRATGTRFR
ncbi:MAG TPA: hypothetical protein VE058_06770 [Steroidobacteraceae bacterium]|nr:hypothetical protein [Steroidobacteraceae bacterium]